MYQHKRTLGVLALLTLATAPLAAQRVEVYETRPATRGRTLLREAPLSGLQASRRAIIGVTLNLRPSASNDSLGATVAAVTPGGPAARAGIVAGDIIVKFDGTALADRSRRPARADDDEEETEQSAPGLKMLELAARMTPGDTVAVEWRHERQRKTAAIVATEAAGTMVYSGEPGMRFYTDEGPGRFKFQMGEPRGMAELEGLEALRGGMAMTIPDGRMGGNIFMRFGGPLGGVQFAPLNADLGRYFGTTDGILVLETPDSNSHLDLKGGDVIISIGDRKPTSVEHLFRILGSYQADEMVRFDIMRDRRRMTVEAKAEDLQGEHRIRTLERRLMPSEAPTPAPGREAPVPAQPRRTPRPGA